MHILSAIPIWGRVLLGVAALAIIFGGFKSCTATINHKTDVAVDAAEKNGAASAAATAATKGMSNVEQANKAAAKVDRDPAVRRAGCLRHSRTPENC